ncbi:MAG TPA: cytochrome P450, partial [Vicinamibacteria bacterium]|nr:cytochrome P450 [Vicinamibacteria bacterium]
MHALRGGRLGAVPASVNLPPRPRGLPLLGSLLDFRRDPVAFLWRMRALGDVVRVPMALETIYVLFHPDHVREVFVTRQHDFVKGRGIQWMKRFLGEGLLTSEGAFHTRQRRLVQPAFHRQRVGTYAAVMAAYAARARERWADGQVVDLSSEMMTLTLNIVAKALFDADLEHEARDIGDALTDILALFPRFSLPLGELVNRLPLPSNRRFERASRRLDDVVYGLIHERRRSGVDRGDLLSLLLL